MHNDPDTVLDHPLAFSNVFKVRAYGISSLPRLRSPMFKLWGIFRTPLRVTEIPFRYDPTIAKHPRLI